jgi:hypothetical protein
MSDKLLFYYFGDDEACFRSLQSEFKTHAKIPISFVRFFETDECKIQALFLKVYFDKPDVVFIDFSKHTEDYLHLSRLLLRTPLEHNVKVVGLVDYLFSPEISHEIIATGVHLNFIKGADVYDIIFHTTRIVSPQSIGELGFATASLIEDWDAGSICKIGYAHPEGLHIETNFSLSKGNRVLFNNFWFRKQIISSRHAFVKEASANNLFYHFKYNADLDLLFVDDYIPPDGMSEADIKEKNELREEKVKKQKKLMLKWLTDNQRSSLEKRAKLLVVDSTFHIYSDQVRTDKYPYTIRCIPFFDEDIKSVLDRLRPQVIVFEFDKGETAKNTLDSLKKLVSALMSSFPDLKPFLVVFNSDQTSKDLQSTIQYNQTIAYTEELSSELLLKLADMLQKKITNDDDGPTVESKVFLRKSDNASIGEIVNTVKIIKLSESDLILQSDTAYPDGANIHFEQPFDMFVSLSPNPKPSGKVPEYIGLIHSISEDTKKNLRRFINSVFFRDHDAQVQNELDEFKKLNETKLFERMEAERKAKEEAEAKAMAEAQEKEEAKKKAETKNVAPDKPEVK